VTDSSTQTIDLSAPVASFNTAPSPAIGNAPIAVTFTDTSTHNPSSWKWEYNKTIAGTWTQFSTAQNPSYSFPDGIYDIRLTATNIFGNNSIIQPGYITATASHNITATAGAGGTITPSGVVPVAFGANQAFTITNNTGYHITNVLVDGSSVGAVPTYTFNNVVTDHTIAASFAITTYTITASAGTGGTISPSGSVNVNESASQTFTITKNAGYHIADVLVDGSSVGAVSTYTFTNVHANHTISATFAANARVTIFSDNFDTAFAGWTAGGTPGAPTWYTGSCKNGSHSIQLVNTDRMTRTIPTTGYSGIIVSSALGANLLEAGEYIQAQYNTGAGWTMWAQIIDPGDDNILHNFNSALPAAADHNAAFQLRFRLYGNLASDYGYVDDVLVTGIPD
jgi:PKD repeat protein